MNTQTRQQLHPPTRAILSVDGRLDAVSALAVKAEIKELVEGGYVDLIVDLEETPFLDSSGLAALVSGLKAARQAGGTLKLAGLREQAQTVLRLTMLDRVFEIYPGTEEALASFQE